MEINGMFLSAKEIYSPVLKSGKKKKKRSPLLFFASNKNCPSGLLYPVTMASLSHKVTGRGPCRSRDLLAKSWTLSEWTPLPSLQGCPCPQPPWDHRRWFPHAAWSSSCVVCDFLRSNSPMCQGDLLHPGHRLSWPLFPCCGWRLSPSSW